MSSNVPARQSRLLERPPVHSSFPGSPGARKRLWHTTEISVNALRHVHSVGTTTIHLSKEIKKALESMKLYPGETYEEVLGRLLEDLRILSEETKREIEQAIREIKAGKARTHEQLESEMGS